MRQQSFSIHQIRNFERRGYTKLIVGSCVNNDGQLIAYCSANAFIFLYTYCWLLRDTYSSFRNNLIGEKDIVAHYEYNTPTYIKKIIIVKRFQVNY